MKGHDSACRATPAARICLTGRSAGQQATGGACPDREKSRTVAQTNLPLREIPGNSAAKSRGGYKQSENPHTINRSSRSAGREPTLGRLVQFTHQAVTFIILRDHICSTQIYSTVHRTVF